MRADNKITPKSVFEYYQRKFDFIFENIHKMTEMQVNNELHCISSNLRIHIYLLDQEVSNDF